MYKWTLTYTDFDDRERTEDFYFNFTKAELIEMEVAKSGGLAAMLQRIIDAKDTPEIIMEIKRLLLNAYGVKSGDGRHFMKNDQIRAEFEHSEPYSIMFMELSMNDEKAAEFINGVMPKELRDQASKEAGNNGNLPLLMPAT